MQCHIEALTIYPVKACRGQSLDEARCSPFGLAGDRQFVITRQGKCITQKEKPELASITALWQEDGRLKLEHDLLTPFTLTPLRDKPTGHIKLVMDEVAVTDQGDEVASG